MEGLKFADAMLGLLDGAYCRTNGGRVEALWL